MVRTLVPSLPMYLPQTRLYDLLNPLCIVCIFADDSPSARQLLLKIVPNGDLPSLPDGFPSLDKLKAETFDYVIKDGKVTAKITLQDPVNLLGEGMTIRDVSMTFVYSKDRTRKGHWSFNAKGETET